jgi:hypothetical protein
VDEIQRTIPKTEAEISDTEQVEQADRDLEAGVQFSDNPYSYKAITSKPDMAGSYVDDYVPKDRNDIISIAKQNAANIGSIDPKTGSVSVYVKDIGRNIGIGRDGLKHSFDRRIAVNAPVIIKAGEIISNSIRINELTPKKDNIEESYVLIGAARNANDDLYIVRSVINRFTHNLVSMDVLYAINAKKEPAALLPLSAEKTALGTDSKISIAKLLDYVNQYFPDILPEDILKKSPVEENPGEGRLYHTARADRNQHKENEPFLYYRKDRAKMANGAVTNTTSVKRSGSISNFRALVNP